jgi:hypothetical protein
MAEKKSWNRKFDAASGNFWLELVRVIKEAGINLIFLINIRVFLLAPDFRIGSGFGITWKVGSGSGVIHSGSTRRRAF